MNAPPTAQRLDLPIEGMTCASCATRIERKLNRLDGVQATVNYATERASVALRRRRVTPGELVAAVEAAGYAALLPAAGVATGRPSRIRPARCASASSSLPSSRCPCWRWR